MPTDTSLFPQVPVGSNPIFFGKPRKHGHLLTGVEVESVKENRQLRKLRKVSQYIGQKADRSRECKMTPENIEQKRRLRFAIAVLQKFGRIATVEADRLYKERPDMELTEYLEELEGRLNESYSVR